MNTSAVDTFDVLKTLWSASWSTPLPDISLGSDAPGLPTSFAVAEAAQASIAAAAAAAVELYKLRSGETQDVSVALNAAERECTGYFRIDGATPNAWAPFSGLYPTKDGFVRVHANFDHHRDGVLKLTGIDPHGTGTPDDLAAALSGWEAEAFETAASELGLVVAKARSFDEWDAHEHALANRRVAPVRIERLDDADPQLLPPIDVGTPPMSNVRVLDLTRILAGPICGRTLAGYGADVLLVNGPHLPNIDAIIDTSRGKRSAQLDLRQQRDHQQLLQLLEDADVFVQGYRPGGMDKLGLSPRELAKRRPGIVCVSLNAYGDRGPWADKRGFDSLVQTATGFNVAEAEAFGASKPKPMPVQILDFASAFLMAFGALTALHRRATEGGSWHVQVSLLHTASWLREMGSKPTRIGAKLPGLKTFLAPFACEHGTLEGIAHAANFSATPTAYLHPSAMPGAHPPTWSP